MDATRFIEELEKRISDVCQEMLKDNTERTIEKVNIEAHYPSGTIWIKAYETK
jgi:hypothetical protein